MQELHNNWWNIFFFRHYQWETQTHLGYLVANHLAFWNPQFKWVFVLTKKIVSSIFRIIHEWKTDHQKIMKCNCDRQSKQQLCYSGCGKAPVSILNQSLHNYVLHHEISRASFFGAGNYFNLHMCTAAEPRIIAFWLQCISIWLSMQKLN